MPNRIWDCRFAADQHHDETSALRMSIDPTPNSMISSPFFDLPIAVSGLNVSIISDQITNPIDSPIIRRMVEAMENSPGHRSAWEERS
jgi:hypothetical protein